MRGWGTPPQNSPLSAFGLAPAQREPWPLPPSRAGFCETCELPLKPGEIKFHRDLHGFSCKAAFYAICKHNGVAFVSRDILIRRTRPRGGGAPIPGVALTAARELRQMTDDLIARMREASRRLGDPS